MDTYVPTCLYAIDTGEAYEVVMEEGIRKSINQRMRSLAWCMIRFAVIFSRS